MVFLSSNHALNFMLHCCPDLLYNITSYIAEDRDLATRIPILDGSEPSNMEADCFRMDHVMIYCAPIGVPETAL